MLFFFYWGALLLCAMSSNHFLMACELELYSPHIWWLLSSYFSLVFHCHVYHFGKKSLTTRRASIHPAFMGNCMAISCSLIYLVDEFIILWCYWTKWECWVNLRFVVLIKGMREWCEFKIFLCYPRGSVTSHQPFCEWGGIFSVHGVFISD